LCVATPSNTRSLHGWSRAAHGHEGATPREIRRAPYRTHRPTCP
jgi:hypothetical protein